MKLRIALGAAVAALAATSAANAATATAAASANIVAPGALTSTRDLNFGTIARPTTGAGNNTITVLSQLNPATPGLSGGGDGSIPIPGQGQAAIFHLIGSPGQTYTVGASDLSFSGAGTNLTAIGAESPAASSGSVVGTLPAGGVADLYIGGHFTISPTTAVNTYTGTLSLTINFN